MLPDYQMERQSPDKKLYVAGTTTVPLHKRVVLVNAATTIFLPNVSEAEGRKFIVSALTADVVVDYNNGAGTTALSTTIGTTGVDLEFESTGVEWIVSGR